MGVIIKARDLPAVERTGSDGFGWEQLLCFFVSHRVSIPISVQVSGNQRTVDAG